MKNFISFTFILLCVSSALGQRLLSLEEALSLQEKNKSSINNSTLEEQIAEAEFKKSKAAQLPQISAGVDLRYNAILQTNILPAGALGEQPREVQFGTDFNYLAGISLTQSIYNPINQSSIAIARNNKNTEVAQSEQLRRDERLNLTMAYYDVLLKKAALAQAQKNLERSEVLLQEAEYNFAQGKILTLDKKRVELDVANARTTLNNAKYQLETSFNFLKKECGLQEQETIDITDTPESIELKSTAIPNYDKAFQNRPELKIEKSLLLQEELNVQRFKKAVLPGVDFYANLSTNYLDNDALDVISGRWYPFSFIGVKANIPIFDGNKRRSELEQANLRKMTHQNNIQQLERDFNYEFLKAKNEFLNARDEMKNAKENVLLAEQIFLLDLALLQGGKKLNSEISESNRTLKEAQYNYISSIYRFLNADLNWKKSSGQ